MTIRDLLMSFGTNLLGSFPFYITMAIGAVVALFTWKQHRKVSLLALLGFSLMVLLEVMTSFIYATLPFLHSRQDWESTTLATIYTVTGVATHLLDVLPWTLLMMAIFLRRQPDAAGGAAVEP